MSPPWLVSSWTVLWSWLVKSLLASSNTVLQNQPKKGLLPQQYYHSFLVHRELDSDHLAFCQILLQIQVVTDKLASFSICHYIW